MPDMADKPDSLIKTPVMINFLDHCYRWGSGDDIVLEGPGQQDLGGSGDDR